MPLGLLMLQRYKLSLVIAITSFALLAALAVGMAIIGITVGMSFILAFAIPLILVGMLGNRRALWLMIAATQSCLMLVFLLVVSRPGIPPPPNPPLIDLLIQILSIMFVCFAIGLLLDRISGMLHSTMRELSDVNRRLRIELRRRTSAELSLLDREAYLRLIAEHTHDIIATLHYDGRVLYVNPAIDTLLGYAPDQLIGTNLFDLVHVDDRQTAQTLCFVAQSTGFAQGSMRFVHDDHSMRWINANITHVNQDQSGFVVLIGRDTTQQRALEAQLIQVQKMESMGQLAGGIAHDFNNLLVVITGYAELARSSLNEGHPVQGDLNDIISTTERARTLTRQLLAFARRQPFSPQPIQINELVDSFERLLKRLLREDIELRIVHERPYSWVLADPDQIGQVLMNLTTNARDAMPNGGMLAIGTAQMILQPTDQPPLIGLPPGVYATITLCDTGIGMDEATMRRIFEPFFTTKAAGQGTGLGMAICYGILQQHQGGLHVQSQRSVGTTMTIYLPCIQAPTELSMTPPTNRTRTPA
ncbi:MAG: hypothetical protein Fur005_17110 [Roseiflexaceae bacterium]